MKLLEPGTADDERPTFMRKGHPVRYPETYVPHATMRQCNGTCARKLLFDGTFKQTAIIVRCSVCKYDTNWFLVSGGNE